MPKICNVEDCTYPVWGKGYCKSHQHLRKDKNKPKKPKFRSDREQERLNKYYPIRSSYLEIYPQCEFPECPNKSTDIHHMAGRMGDLLFNTKYFAALCRMHHSWVEVNPKEAKVLGLSFDRLDK